MDAQSQTTLQKEYLDQMQEHEKQAYLIAKDHLGTSFNLIRSNGYIEWIKKREKSNRP